MIDRQNSLSCRLVLVKRRRGRLKEFLLRRKKILKEKKGANFDGGIDSKKPSRGSTVGGQQGFSFILRAARVKEKGPVKDPCTSGNAVPREKTPVAYHLWAAWRKRKKQKG